MKKMKTKIALLIAGFSLCASLILFFPEKASARDCWGGQKINGSGNLSCGRSGGGCMRSCGFLEFK